MLRLHGSRSEDRVYAVHAVTWPLFVALVGCLPPGSNSGDLLDIVSGDGVDNVLDAGRDMSPSDVGDVAYDRCAEDAAQAGPVWDVWSPPVIGREELSLQQTTGLSLPVGGRTIAVPANEETRALTLSVRGEELVLFHFSHLTTASGEELIPGGPPYGWPPGINPARAYHGRNTLLVPNSSAAAAVLDGNGILLTISAHTVNLQGDLEPVASTVDLRLVTRQSTPTTGIIDVVFHLTGAGGLEAGSAAAEPAMQAVLDRTEELLLQAGIGLGEVVYEDVDPVWQLLELGEQAPLQPLWALLPENPGAIAVFLVSEILPAVGSGEVRGQAGGIPGEPFGAGSVVALAWEAHDGATEIGTTLAHELGHLLGLFHTVEFSLWDDWFDPIADTIEFAQDNLMYFDPATAGTLLSPEQGQVMRAHPWVRSQP